MSANPTTDSKESQARFNFYLTWCVLLKFACAIIIMVSTGFAVFMWINGKMSWVLMNMAVAALSAIAVIMITKTMVDIHVAVAGPYIPSDHPYAR